MGVKGRCLLPRDVGFEDAFRAGIGGGRQLGGWSGNDGSVVLECRSGCRNAGGVGCEDVITEWERFGGSAGGRTCFSEMTAAGGAGALRGVGDLPPSDRRSLSGCCN